MSDSGFRVYGPAPALAPFVQCYWSLRGDFTETQTLFPDGCMELVFQLGDPFARIHDDGSREIQTRTLFAGQLRKYMRLAPEGRVNTFGIRFRPGGTAAFMNFPVGELVNKVIPADAVIGPLAGELADRLAERRDARSTADMVLAKHLMPLRERPAVDCALDQIVRSAGAVTMGAVASNAGVTRRHLERMFRDRIGIGPKSFARIVRFQQALRSPARDWAHIAADCGYFDQAHLVHEFREFTGQTPSEWRASQVAFLQDTESAAR